jgi:hypothetical protein
MKKPSPTSGPTLRPSVYKTACKTCNGDGFYFRLPNNINPFLCNINQIARMTRKIKCSCGAAQPAPDAPSERLGGFHPSIYIEEEMKERGWSSGDMGLDEVSRLSLDIYLANPGEPGLRLGEDLITALSDAFGTSQTLWRNLELSWLASIAPPTPANRLDDGTTKEDR